MKKLISFLTLLLVFNLTFSQDKSVGVSFDTKFYNAIDKYIAFPSIRNDGLFDYGFIYIDLIDGISFRHEGSFKMDDEGVILANKTREPKTYKLDKKTINVYILKKKQIKSLNLPQKPKWLEEYNRNKDNAEYLRTVGNMLNSIGGYETALTYLKKAYSSKPHLKGLEYELAFAYNALQQYDKVVPILKKAIKNDSTNFSFYKELGYSYKHLGLVNEAEKTYQKAVKLATNDNIKIEFAINMSHAYFELRDREKFNKWSKMVRIYSKPDSPSVKYIDMLEGKWDK